MTNRHHPRYIDDADFTTNAPSYYEDLARKEKLIRLLAERIWGYEKILDETLEEIQERFRAWDKNLEDFPDDVKALLQNWLDDGTLDHIINETIFNWKLDTSIFEQFRDAITAQLQHTMTKLDKPVINMKEYPRVAGETDDTARINRAITSLGGKAGKIELTESLYEISDYIGYTASGQMLVGTNPNGTTIRLTVSGTVIKVDDSVDFMGTTLARVGFENILIETMASDSIGLDFRGINYGNFKDSAIVIRGVNSKAIWATSESGLNGYYNDFSDVDLQCTASPISTNGCYGYHLTNNPTANHVAGANRRAPNANKISGGRVSGFQYGLDDVGIGNYVDGTKFESNYKDLTLGSDDLVVFNVGTTNHTVIVGTYHEGGTTTHTTLTIKQSAARATWMPSNVTGFSSSMFVDNGTRSNILFFGSSTSTITAKILGYLLLENVTMKELTVENSTTSPKSSLKNTVNASGKDIWTQNVSHSNVNQTWRLWNNSDANVMVEVSNKGNAKFYNGVSGGAFATASRPTGVQTGTMIFDTDLGKPIWYSGSGWKDVNGTSV